MEHFYSTIPGWFNFQNIYSEMVQRFPNGSHFVEIGAWFGCSTAYMAVEIANSGKLIWFDTVDTWEGSVNEPEHYRIVTEHGGNIYKAFLDYLRPVLQYVKPIRMTSEAASKCYTDNSLDFVFIDGEHTYSAVTLDLNCWHPKVKKDGIIGGHDYHSDWPEVKQAVDDFFKGRVVQNGTSWIVQN
jgi:hypothetical protein